jgi:hypothetical protein
MATIPTGPTAGAHKPLATSSENASLPSTDPEPGGYIVPLVHTRIPEPLVQLGFWGGLAGTVAFGVIDAPLAALVGVGVIVARHRRDR